MPMNLNNARSAKQKSKPPEFNFGGLLFKTFFYLFLFDFTKQTSALRN